jgi:hypothetical protein
VDHSTVEIYDSVGAGTYVHNTTLFPAAPADTSWQMGWETQVSGNTVLSSAPGNGELDVFVRNGGVWSQQATLPFSTSDPLYAFDGNRVVLPLSSGGTASARIGQLTRVQAREQVPVSCEC